MGKNKLGVRAYRTMLRLYDKGTRVEAVSVYGVNTGEKGNVISVQETGDIKVNFDKAGEVTVHYPTDVVRFVHYGSECYLRMKRDGEDAECKADCTKCGWNPRVDDARKKKIATVGLVRVKRGIRGLVLHSKDNLA